ncbi:GDP-mannose 4,6-dehydratase [Nitrosomonas communis]|uniref:GDP-D-mannose dehydratase n=1 Tax=Nitrosomonas communis TaxID=44574 RepID=A0A1I4MS00_9PROT|nr:GDP-mannose 4,6-dehydratase [Nitrosomonas communis]SFM05826.1 GDP-D-mannose dehydratase [Nitrosomonas communis]
MKALITGIAGFTGRYLAYELDQAGCEVYGIAHKLPELIVAGAKSVYVCDLANTNELAHVIEKIKPDVVAHLAAIAFVAHGDVETIYHTNLVGSRNLLTALSRSSKHPTSVLIASSANVYGNTSEGVLDEATPTTPANDYAVSKLAMEYMARLYMEHLPIIIARPFNYTGIGQSENFLLPKIVNHVRRRAPVIELGNLDVARDFSDVRNVVRFYRYLLSTPAAIGETFNVCSGQAYTLRDVLQMVREISGHDFEVRVNPAFVRSNEVKMLLGSRAKLDATIMEQVPQIPLRETLRWMLKEGDR